MRITGPTLSLFPFACSRLCGSAFFHDQPKGGGRLLFLSMKPRQPAPHMKTSKYRPLVLPAYFSATSSQPHRYLHAKLLYGRHVSASLPEDFFGGVSGIACGWGFACRWRHIGFFIPRPYTRSRKEGVASGRFSLISTKTRVGRMSRVAQQGRQKAPCRLLGNPG